jgi:hypothetical protein
MDSETANIALWVFHIMAGLFAFVMSAISARATVTVLFVLALEFFSLLGGMLPGGAEIGFTLRLFGGTGLVIGLPLSLGRGKLAWWFLPTLAVGTFVVLRVPVFFGEDARTFGRGMLSTLISALALGGGMLAGRGLVALTPFGRSPPRRQSSI